MPLKKYNKIAKLAIAIFFAIFISGFIEIRDVFAKTVAPNIGTDFGSSAGSAGTSKPSLKGQAIQTDSPHIVENIQEHISEDIKEYNKQTWWDKLLEQIKETGSAAIISALGSALNNLAYDTATWIGSGGKGQKPMFITEGWGEYLTNIGDNAAGTFMEQMGRQWNFNLCEPDFALKMKIGLGLKQYARPKKPACTFREMKKNWEKELKDPNFLPKFQDMFEPTSNDLGIALSLQTGMWEETEKQKYEGYLQRANSKSGWLDVRGNITGWATSPPGEAERQAEQVRKIKSSTFAQYTGNAFTDAINIFLNQLALTSYNNLMKKLAENKKPHTSPYEGDFGGFSGLADKEASGGFGAAETKEALREIIEPKFNIRGDYDILAELTMCPDPNKAGPTNCVITDKFRQAIAERKTVGEAIDAGYLNKEGTFGFTADGLEPDYTEGYPYRSMLILRKFRILPVGWEVAAQYIKENSNSAGTLNLGKLAACFSEGDEYRGYDAEWCRGLIDPSWVLKAPLNYCAKEGFGPEIMNEQTVGEGEDSELVVSRNDNYCADEQSCVKENDDGSCQLYGYCAEETAK